MHIDGYMIREALKQWDLRKTTSEQAFKGTLHKFEGDVKDTPQAVVEEYLRAEEAIAKLQVVQMRYNLAVKVTVLGESMILAEAIKRVGSAGRVEKMWKSAAPKERASYYDDQLTRDPTQERAKPTLTLKEITELTAASTKRSGAFRAAIATANAVSIDIEDLNPSLFE